MARLRFTRQHLLTVMVRLPSDFEPCGGRRRLADGGPDRSCGCRWFAPLRGGPGSDCGVCADHASPRAGLLTLEHHGCEQYECVSRPVDGDES